MSDLKRFDSFGNLIRAANIYYEGGDASMPRKIATSGYGEEKMLGYVRCQMDGGDIQVQAIFDTEKNHALVLEDWNVSVDNEIEEQRGYPMTQEEAFSEWLPYFLGGRGFTFSASLWG